MEDAENCSKELKSSTITTTTSHQFLAIFFVKKQQQSLAKNGPSQRQRMHCKAKEVLQKSSSTKTWRIFIHTREVAIMTTNIEILCHSSGGSRSTKCYMTGLPWRIIHTSRQELREFLKMKHWILKLNQDGAQPPLTQRLDFARAKRECKRLHDEHMANTQQKKEPFLANNK